MTSLVVVLTGPTSVVLEAIDAGSGALTASEAERMRSFRRPEDRQDFLAGHLLVRACAARLLRVAAADVAVVQRCPTCGGPHGRPQVVGHPELGASLAHSRGVVAAAAGAGPVGVDVEAAPPAGEPLPNGLTAAELTAALTAAERQAVEAAPDPARALLVAWARKEAFVKAGVVDLDDLRTFDLSGLPVDTPPGDRTLRSARHGRWAVHDWWDALAGAVGAVAAPAGAAVTLAGPSAAPVAPRSVFSAPGPR